MALTVAVCSSTKFYDVAAVASKLLERLGYRVITPNFDYDEAVVDVTPEQKRILTLDFLDKVRVRAVTGLYVIDVNGYTGCSVAIEVAYAYALGVKIVCMEPPTEAAVAALCDDVIPINDLTAETF